MEKGFRYDRRWMLVNEENGHVTQRTHPHLSQIGVSLSNESIIATHRNMSDLKIPFTLKNGNSVQVTIWDDQVDALEAPQHINEWFSTINQNGIVPIWTLYFHKRLVDKGFFLLLQTFEHE